MFNSWRHEVINCVTMERSIVHCPSSIVHCPPSIVHRPVQVLVYAFSRILLKPLTPSLLLFQCTCISSVSHLFWLWAIYCTCVYIVIVLISLLLYFLSSLRRGDQSTVFCIVSSDFNWSRSPKIRHPLTLVCRCGLADIRMTVRTRLSWKFTDVDGEARWIRIGGWN